MSNISKKFLNKKIALLGFGIENRSFLAWLLDHGVAAEITVCDSERGLDKKHPEFARENIFWRLGADYDQGLEGFDLVLRVPGYPLFSPALKKAAKAGCEISSPTKLFFELSPTAKIIGVTGTKGKGTTSGLIVEALAMAGKKAYWGGNIGIPIFFFIDKITKDDWVVLELSSFQLEDLAASPRIAVITNLYKEHLRPADPNNPNYHKSYRDYILAKLNIVKYQNKNDTAIINKKIDFSPASTRRGNYSLGRGRKIYFTKSDLETRLPGEHNRENIAAAAAAAKAAGVRPAIIKKAAKKFKGLPHRLELAAEKNGIKYYDDSFATTPDSAITALDSFSGPIVLLAGGADKGSSFTKLAHRIKDRVKHVVLFAGAGTDRLKKELRRIAYPADKLKVVKSMPEACRAAEKQAEPGDVILLSPACASFGIFKNYKERGELFKIEVGK